MTRSDLCLKQHCDCCVLCLSSEWATAWPGVCGGAGWRSGRLARGEMGVPEGEIREGARGVPGPSGKEGPG